MNMRRTVPTLVATAVMSATFSGSAMATHFRGAALTPSVDADGTLTINATSFWRQSEFASVCSFPHDCIASTASVTGPGGFSTSSESDITQTQDLTDTRRTEVTEQFTFDISNGGAGSYDISWGGSSWVHDLPNASGGYGTTSTISWDGESDSTPILFNLNNIQQEVNRNTDYSDNLGAVAGSGLSLSYAETLSSGMSSQPVGYSVSSTGEIQITDAGTDQILDNPNSNSPGADVAFSGEILADDGSSVEFVWVFDGVDEALSPNVDDQIINALVGDTISTTIVANDPNGEDLIFDLQNFVGPGAGIGDVSFDPATGLFEWDSTGFEDTQYVASIRATNESGLTDTGTITINLSLDQGDGTPVPAPATLLLFGAGLLTLGGMVGRRQRRH